MLTAISGVGRIYPQSTHTTRNDMKVQIELDISWLRDDDSIDDVILRGVTKRLAETVEARLTDDITKAISARASAIVNAKTEVLIHTMLEKPVAVSTGWSSKTEYASLYDMIEQKMTALYEGKYSDTKSCGKDPLLVQVENSVKQGFSVMVKDLEKKVNAAAVNAVKTEAKENALINALSKVLQ